jgi:hypothetical protein
MRTQPTVNTCPLVWVVQHTSSKHIPKNLIHPLYLTIGLRMVSRAMNQMHPQVSMQLLPEASYELGTSIRNDGLRHTMQTQDARNIQFSVLRRCSLCFFLLLKKDQDVINEDHDKLVYLFHEN